MGVEPIKNPAIPGENQVVSEPAGSAAGSEHREIGVCDPDLQTILEAWPSLPETIRAGIVVMVRTVPSGKRR